MPTFESGASASTDGTGGATLRVNGPQRMGLVRELSQVVIKSTANATGGLPQAALYKSLVIRSALLGESRAADKVTFEGFAGDELHHGEQLIVVVTNATPATTVTVNVRGIERPA